MQRKRRRAGAAMRDGWHACVVFQSAAARHGREASRGVGPSGAYGRRGGCAAVRSFPQVCCGSEARAARGPSPGGAANPSRVCTKQLVPPPIEGKASGRRRAERRPPAPEPTNARGGRDAVHFKRSGPQRPAGKEGGGPADRPRPLPAAAAARPGRRGARRQQGVRVRAPSGRIRCQGAKSRNGRAGAEDARATAARALPRAA